MHGPTPRSTACALTTAATLALVALAARPVSAQGPGAKAAGAPSHQAREEAPSRWGVGARAGVAIPHDNFGGLVDRGRTVGVSGSYALAPGLRVLLGGRWEGYSARRFDNGNRSPAFDVRHYALGLDLRVLRAREVPVGVELGLGGGLSTYDAGTFTDGDTFQGPGLGEVSFRETYPTAYGDLEVSVAPLPDVRVTGGGRFFLTFSDEGDTAVFSELTDGTVGRFGTVLLTPVTLGLEVGL